MILKSLEVMNTPSNFLSISRDFCEAHKQINSFIARQFSPYLGFFTCLFIHPFVFYLINFIYYNYINNQLYLLNKTI